MFVIYFCRYDDLTERFSVEYVPGGATQNTTRIAQVSHLKYIKICHIFNEP